jgi:hypothetical protein
MRAKMRQSNEKINKLLVGLAGLTAAGFISISAVATYAAYLALSKNHFDLSYQTDAMVSNYFASGSGTSSSPYIINTPDQLRNLQKLNALGLFNVKTYFSLGDNDITWSGDPLKPIGSDDEPFFGEFNGNGRTITGLVVNGTQTWDVGMFGYVDRNALVQNFILSGPSIVLGANSDGNAADTTNPLNHYLRTAAQNLAQPKAPTSNVAASGYLSWTDTSVSDSVFYSTVSGLDSTVTAYVDGQAVTLPIEWTSSDTTLFNNSSGSWRTYATSTTSDDTDLTQVMLTGRVHASVDGRVMAYTLERYEINILGNGKITPDTVTLTSDSTGTVTSAMRGIFKTLWPLDAAGASTDFHGTYVGFFIGHLDGKAKYLGLYGGNSASPTLNAKIEVSGRKGESNTCLIGHSRGDDVRDGTGSNQYGHTFDFTKNAVWTNFSGPTNGIYTSSSQFNLQTANMKQLTGLYGVSSSNDAYQYMRIYPSAEHGYVSYSYTDANGNTVSASNIRTLTYTQALGGASYTEEETQNYVWPTVNTNGDVDSYGQPIYDEKDITTSSPKVSRVADYLETDWYNNRYYDGYNGDGYDSIGGYRHRYYDWNMYHYGHDADGNYYQDFDISRYRRNMNLVRKFAVNNGFWVYTKGSSKDVMNTIMGNNTFTLNFKIVYIASTDETDKTKNSWQVLYNAYNPRICRFQPCYQSRQRKYNSSTGRYYWQYYYDGFIYQDSYLQNVQWYDLHNPMSGGTEADINTSNYYNEITSSYTYKNYYNDTIGAMSYGADSNGSQYDPTLEANKIIADGTLHEANVAITVNRKSSFWSAYFDTYFSNDTWYPCFAIGPGKTNSLAQDNNNYSIWNGPFQQRESEWSRRGTKSQRGIDDGASHIYNSNFALDGNLRLNVLSFQSVFTNASGNISELTTNVDYMYDISSTGAHWDTTSKSFTSWNTASGVKISFNVAQALATGNSSYYFYREEGNNGIGAVVHALYNNATYAPKNDTKYTQATIAPES